MAKKATRTDLAMDNHGQIGSTIVSVVDDKPFTPTELAQYKEIDPDFARAMMDMAQKEQEHRHDIDRQRARAIKRSQRHAFCHGCLGMFIAGLIVLAFLGLAAYALYLDHPWFAGAFTLTALLPLVQLFIPKKENQ